MYSVLCITFCITYSVLTFIFTLESLVIWSASLIATFNSQLFSFQSKFLITLMHGKGLRNLWFQNDRGPDLHKSACILKADILFARTKPKRKEAVLATKLVSRLTSPGTEVITPCLQMIKQHIVLLHILLFLWS